MVSWSPLLTRKARPGDRWPRRGGRDGTRRDETRRDEGGATIAEFLQRIYHNDWQDGSGRIMLRLVEPAGRRDICARACAAWTGLGPGPRAAGERTCFRLATHMGRMRRGTTGRATCAGLATREWESPVRTVVRTGVVSRGGCLVHASRSVLSSTSKDGCPSIAGGTRRRARGSADSRTGRACVHTWVWAHMASTWHSQTSQASLSGTCRRTMPSAGCGPAALTNIPRRVGHHDVGRSWRTSRIIFPCGHQGTRGPRQ
ncbi:uncharacterized protein B0I36DRAFT_341208 [Microdochium trichocladiopsis]|uniref:Uncharacterized protein n=1 Tax=Microdochium trichocladiopsis TaxID=1682393 RepID=A0A9P8XQ82_9PEZI|nr:uncharacterized protein B0I36DRAFT_341208 [Microdochium trichocladiopsis]KAH7010837.1 hypothetical protein B0I36DRAFT_341208 [Microdochium trichocladiopsis]